VQLEKKNSISGAEPQAKTSGEAPELAICAFKDLARRKNSVGIADFVPASRGLP
jgi:hypothetical protein